LKKEEDKTQQPIEHITWYAS